MRGVNDVALNHHVLVDEIGRVRIVGDNTAHLRRRQINLVNAFFSEECLYRPAIQQIQLVAGAEHQLHILALRQLSYDGGTHHPAMARHKNTLFHHPQDSSAMATS